MCPNDADGMANSVNPRSSLIWVYTDLSFQKLRIMTAFSVSILQQLHVAKTFIHTKVWSFEPCRDDGIFCPKLILQTCMHSHPVGLEVWFLVWPFVYFHISCVPIAKALARLCRCAGSPKPSLVAYGKYHNLMNWLIYSWVHTLWAKDMIKKCSNIWHFMYTKSNWWWW